MKKLLLFLSITLLLLSGCAKIVSREQATVTVTIVGEDYDPMWIQPIRANSITTMITHPASYNIIIEYNGEQYTIDDRDTYYKYCDKVGTTTAATLETTVYDNGLTSYNIIGLE